MSGLRRPATRSACREVPVLPGGCRDGLDGGVGDAEHLRDFRDAAHLDDGEKHAELGRVSRWRAQSSREARKPRAPPCGRKFAAAAA